MKRLLFIFLVLGLSLLGYSAVNGADWKYFVTAPSGKHFYDAQGIKTLSSGNVTIPMKIIFSKERLNDIVAQSGSDAKALNYVIHLIEMNCNSRQMAMVSSSYYKKDGGLMKVNEEEHKWQPIKPENPLDTLLTVACFKKEEKVQGDWIYTGFDPSAQYFYDSKSISYSKPNIVKVKTKFVYTEYGRKLRIEEAKQANMPGNEYEYVSHMISLSEMDCLEKKWRALSTIEYGKGGKVIYSATFPKEVQEKWIPISPESGQLESLYGAICKKKTDN